MLKALKYIEHALIWGILVVISVMLVLSFIDIVYEIKENIIKPPILILDASKLMDLFSLVLVLLIGLELLETVKAYLKEDIVHVEFIILVAVIAIARKVIVWDFKKYSNEELVSLAIMILALGVTYFLIKKADLKIKVPRNREKNNP